MSEFTERRQSVQSNLDLRETISRLNLTVGDLKVTLGELKITVANLAIRDTEDRSVITSIISDVTILKIWKGRIQGQIAILSLVVGLIGGGGLAYILKP